MPLIDCPDCAKKISDAAPSCIHCGRPMKDHAAAQKLSAALTLAPCPKCGSTNVKDKLAEVVQEGGFNPFSAMLLGGFAAMATKGRFICNSCNLQWKSNS
jgi:DNA-directed RNA polymerase subunit RPC12/RpoP